MTAESSSLAPSRRRLLFAAMAVAIALLAPLVILLAADIYLHGRFEASAGFNVWGYRGPVARRKRAGEYRVVVLGGSSAYGYGSSWADAIPAVLERKLAGPSVGGDPAFTVFNLGYNNEGAYSFTFTLEDYLSLDYDLACLYEGYNDLMGDPRAPNLSVFRHDSPIFRLTGYLPIFPIVFKEKAASILNAGDIGALYRFDHKTAFRPPIASRTEAEVLQLAAEMGESLERQLGRATAEPRRQIESADSTGCKYPWQQYCRSIFNAVEFALQHGKQVLVATQPYELGTLRVRHAEQQREMAGMLARQFGADRRVRYVNLGELVDFSNPSLSFDRMHLTKAGNQAVAEALVGPVRDMALARH